MQEAAIILGMHRSGTSHVARLVAAEGFELPEDLLPSQPQSNPDGYQKSTRVADINNRFLLAIGSFWKDPGPLPAGCFESVAAEEARVSIRHFLLANPFPKLVLKDPRLCRLLPLWLEVMREIGVDCRLVHVVRQPREVYRSLKRRASIAGIHRGGIELENHSNLLWWRHTTEAREYGKNLPGFFLAYESLITDPLSVRGQLLNFLGLDTDTEPNSLWKEVRRAEPAVSIDVGGKVSQDVERFLNETYLWALKPGTIFSFPMNAPALPLPGARHPMPPADYECLSAAALKHLSGTISHPDRKNGASAGGVPGRAETQIDFVFVGENPHWPCHIYRIKNPVDALNRAGVRSIWLTNDQLLSDLSILDNAGCVVIHRVSWGPGFLKIVNSCKARAIPVAYDLDDLIFLPELVESGCRDALNRKGEAAIREWVQRSVDYQRCIAECDFFIGSTGTIVEAAKQFNAHCLEIPNGFSPENLAMANLARESRTAAKNQVVLGYASGTDTHQADFAQIVDGIWRLMSTDSRVLLSIIGPLNLGKPAPAQVEDRIQRRALVPHVNLPFELARFDVNLAPLERNRFCDAKSPLKYFEAGLVAVPTIATENPTYAEVAGPQTGCLMAASGDDWWHHLRKLSQDHSLRESLGAAARRNSIEHFHSDRLASKYHQLRRP